MVFGDLHTNSVYNFACFVINRWKRYYTVRLERMSELCLDIRKRSFLCSTSYSLLINHYTAPGWKLISNKAWFLPLEAPYVSQFQSSYPEVALQPKRPLPPLPAHMHTRTLVHARTQSAEDNHAR